MAFEPDAFLGDGISVFAERWEEDFRSYWGLDSTEPPEHLSESEWRGARILHDLSAKLLEAIDHFGSPKSPPVRALLNQIQERIGEDVRENELLNLSLDLRLSRRAGDDLYNMRARTLELLDFLATTESEIARQYLLRVGNCYIHGMKTEGTVMCRAVLETALEEFIDDQEVLAAGNAKRRHGVDLHDRLHHCREEDLLSPEAWKAADAVRRSGNDAVHAAPDMPPDLKTIVRYLSTVLREIEQLRGHGKAPA